ncbi:hypothetical protein G7Y79_00141g102130 [Physcia stellaris]|nr:hypothetical protein G7Y79_00141g102130 [Physcia stellaris]
MAAYLVARFCSAAQYTSSLITATLLLLVLFLLVRKSKAKQAEAFFEQIHGCCTPRRLPYSWPLALDIVVYAFRTIGEKQVLQWFVDIFDRTGPTFEQYILGAKGINTIEPENIESILSSNFAGNIRDGYHTNAYKLNALSGYGLGARRPTFYPLLGDGIFTQDAASGRHSRETLRPLFSFLRTDIFVQFEEHTEHLINCIAPNQSIDLQPLFFQFTLDMETFFFSATDFAEAFRISQGFLFRRGRLGNAYWMIDGMYFRKQCATVHRFIDEAVEEALSVEHEHDNSEGKHGFLNALIREGTRNPRKLRDQLLNVMLAGRDTTACCLTWTIRLLAQHPHVQNKLRAEVECFFGVGDECRLPDRNTLKKMRYLSFVLKEVLRLYPSVPINSRTALEATTLPRGGGPDGTKPLMVRKGEAVGYSVYVMHRWKKIYGEDADDFRPERWDPQGKNVVNLKNVGYGYLPFNGGPRVCLGQEFALLEAGYVIVRMLQKFREFEMDPRTKNIAVGAENQEVTLVVASTDGCMIRAVK